MTKRTFTGKGGETWEWDETPEVVAAIKQLHKTCLLYTSPSPRDRQKSRMPSSA